MVCEPIQRQSHVDVLGALADACHAFPAMRAGQIIDNAITWHNGMYSEDGIPDIFYIEDEHLVRVLRGYIEHFSNDES
jgi:hypothetical protein